ncbi:unnamed protein product [Protopolystoma xenopodis]|uniref:Uncharacterized protein n=1 Tax=Protopolystoma xenopodis TaxID=117903 RepID=A0A448X418_9PLAT|nr:unnamed protein product [Protopolystoma xenopodis]
MPPLGRGLRGLDLLIALRSVAPGLVWTSWAEPPGPLLRWAMSGSKCLTRSTPEGAESAETNSDDMVEYLAYILTTA